MKIRKILSGVDFASIKKNGNFEISKIPVHRMLFTILHIHSPLSFEECFASKKVGLPDQFLRDKKFFSTR